MPTVLIIEDDPDMRELERTALQCGGYQVRVAPNGREGLRALSEQRPCVILLDLMMPIMDGLTFLAERRRNGNGVDVPVVCVSAAGPEMMDHALRLGARECLHKPTDLDELCERVRAYCCDSLKAERQPQSAAEVSSSRA
jgi:DNA-binding response OmpR family regulator